MESNTPQSRRPRRLLVFAVLLLLLNLLLLGMLFYGRFSRSGGGFRMLLPQSKLQRVLRLVSAAYVDSVSLSDLEEKAIPEVIGQLDPHSSYIPAEEMAQVAEPLRGDFDGIGVTFNMLTDTVIVQSIIAGGPSERAGVQIGDRFIRVDTTKIAGVKMPQDSVVHLLRGPRGTLVTVHAERPGVEQEVVFEIRRDKIPINSVEIAYMATEKVGVIRLSRFAQTTPQDFQEALIRLAAQGMEALVLDLRDNGGGFLEAANFVASLFLQQGQLIVYTEGRASGRHDLICESEGSLRNIPLSIVINEFSASSSEIVAGAMQDNDRALIVGRRSFGKGLVQEQFEFPDGSGLRLTTSRYYTPSGRCIQKAYTLGHEADYEQELATRFAHGELLEADSIHQDTLQRFHTVGGRTVYGGGGIMPDVFVPIDTTGVTPFYQQVTRRVLHYRYAQRYADAHREVLKGLDSPEAMRRWLQEHNAFGDFLQYLASQGVRPKGRTSPETRRLLEIQLFANIARSVHDNAWFYLMIQDIDTTLQKAVEVLEKPEKYPLAAV